MPDRREFLTQLAGATAALTAGIGTASSAMVAEAVPSTAPRASGSQRRWRTALGLNGFMSAEGAYGGVYPLWEVLDFAQREGFEGVELVEGWPKGMYPDADDDGRIAALRGLYARYNLKIFSIQTFGPGAFQADASAREAWLKQFARYARFARKAGCECMGYWPGGDLAGQTVDQAIDMLVGSLKEAAKIAADEELMLSVEIEPPFAFNTIDHLLRIIDGVGHPSVKGQYDPSHFDVFNGGRGKPEEMLEKFGVHRLGYIHLTDTDGTLYKGTSKHLPCGDGHLDLDKSFEMLWKGGYEGWIMIDAWMIQNPYDACHKGRLAIEAARRKLSSREG
jgi:sugar phosphate isomerase/epimerase